MSDSEQASLVEGSGRVRWWQTGKGKLVYRIGRNAAGILLGNALGEVANSYTIALSAVVLGAAGFGQLSTAQAFLEPFQTLAMFGLGVVSLTVAAHRGGADGTLLGTLSGLHGLFTAGSLGIAFLAAWVTGRADMLPLLAVVAISMLPIPLSAPSNVPIQLDQSMHRLVGVPLLVGLARLGLTYLAIHYWNHPGGHQLAIGLSGILSAVIVFSLSQRWYPSRWSFDWTLAKRLVLLAWPAAVLEFVVMIYSRASYFFLHSAGPQVQGEFAAADRLSRPVLALASALVASSLPSVARLAATNDKQKLWNVYRVALTRSVQVLVPCGILAGIGAPWLLRRFVREYSDAAVPFQILLVGVLFMFLNQISSMFIISAGRFRLIMTVAIMNLVVYLLLASWWIPSYRAVGAALSTTVMEGVNCVAQLLILAMLLRQNAQPPTVET